MLEKDSFDKSKTPSLHTFQRLHNPFIGLSPIKKGKMRDSFVFWELYPEHLLRICGEGSLDFNLRDFYIGKKWEPYYKVFVEGNFTQVGYSSFFDWPSLGYVVLPPSIKRIEERAFSDCDNLSYLKIPGNLEYIGRGAFAYCNEELTVEFYEEKKVNYLTANFFMQRKAMMVLHRK